MTKQHPDYFKLNDDEMERFQEIEKKALALANKIGPFLSGYDSDIVYFALTILKDDFLKRCPKFKELEDD